MGKSSYFRFDDDNKTKHDISMESIGSYMRRGVRYANYYMIWHGNDINVCTIMARLIQPDIMDTTIYTYEGYPLSYIYIFLLF